MIIPKKEDIIWYNGESVDNSPKIFICDGCEIHNGLRYFRMLDPLKKGEYNPDYLLIYEKEFDRGIAKIICEGVAFLSDQERDDFIKVMDRILPDRPPFGYTLYPGRLTVDFPNPP